MNGMSLRSQIAIIALLFSAALVASAQKAEIVVPREYRTPVLTVSAELQSIVAAAVAKVINDGRKAPVKSSEIAVTVIDLSDAAQLKWANYRGEERIYPASVVKITRSSSRSTRSR